MPMTQPSQLQYYLYLAKKHWYLTMVAGVIVALALTYLFQLLTPETPPTQNSFANIQPGQNFNNTTLPNYGDPISSYTTDEGEQVYLYTSDVPIHPHEVHVSENRKVVLIKEFYTFDETNTLEKFVENYGEPDLVLYDSLSPDSVRAHVFLDAGIVAVAHVDGGIVEQQWYFTPSDSETFITGPGKDLSEYGHGPEETLEGIDAIR